MSDRELLEMAAKAAGYKWRKDIAELRNANSVTDLWIYGVSTVWNPLDDNGETLSLLLKLELMISYEPYCKVQIWNSTVSVTEFWGAVGIEKATRRATVRAAAEIGRSIIEKEKA
jgi:hypothetical protein